AVDATPDVEYVRGLALAAARGGDAPAAAVFATRAAAASGDPVVVWIALARALEETGLHVDALAAARSALELANRATIGDALDVASRAGIYAATSPGDPRRAAVAGELAALAADEDREVAFAAVRAVAPR